MSEPVKRGNFHSIPDVRAYCQDCPWVCTAKNGHAAGANHSRHNGHHVVIEVITIYSYGRPVDSPGQVR